jgi:uncharacterized metal-binding protein
MRKEEAVMSESRTSFKIEIESTTGVCPVGETTGNAMLKEGKIPVISCEGGCIRGEIARLAANMVSKEEPFARGCHGEIIAAPHSAIANWARKAEKVVVIDGCFMHCHGRIMKNLISEESLRIFDGLSIYNKYSDLIEIDDVPEAERKETARQVADKVLSDLK